VVTRSLRDADPCYMRLAPCLPNNILTVEMRREEALYHMR